MKNWKTTFIGVIYAVAVLLCQQLSVGHLDWLAVGQAGLGILLGVTASDNTKAETVLHRLFDNWRTTLLGLAAGVFTIVYQHAEPGGITLAVILQAVGVTLFGMLVNDGSVVAKRPGSSDGSPAP